MGVASPPEWRKPASAGKLWTSAPVGLSGVIGDSASRQIGRETDSIPHQKLEACLRLRITDRAVLRLIRMWLRAVVVEEARGDGGATTARRSRQGTPQGGVISPRLANLYLHWFDKVFHLPTGPAHWAPAKLVRYADDFVVLARHQGRKLKEFLEDKLETWMGLEINRDKTRVVHLREEEVLWTFWDTRFGTTGICTAERVAT